MLMFIALAVQEGLWELSDNVSQYEKLPILDAVAMGTGVLGMHVYLLGPSKAYFYL